MQRYITPEVLVQNEGDIGVPLPGSHEIAYGALVPKRGQADNLLVPVCVSSLHIAFGSIRMEPVHGAGALGGNGRGDGDRPRRRGSGRPPRRAARRLLQDGQVLEHPAPQAPRADGYFDVSPVGFAVPSREGCVKSSLDAGTMVTAPSDSRSFAKPAALPTATIVS